MQDAVCKYVHSNYDQRQATFALYVLNIIIYIIKLKYVVKRRSQN